MYLLPLLEVMGNRPDHWLLNNMPEILIMVMKTKCVCALKGSWGSSSIVSFGLPSGGNGGGTPTGDEVLWIAYPDKIGPCGLFQFCH
jgi:hypothetical protein